jgi:TRAP-type C4-dicarboxylate transport system substrate-binding protein
MDKCSRFTGMIVFLLTVILVLPAWAQNAQAQGKPMVLKASIQSPAGVPFTNMFYWLLDEIEKRSGGRIKFERYPGEALAKASEQVDALQSGMADVAHFVTTYSPGKLPLNSIVYMPFTYRGSWVNATSYYQLIQEIPEVKAEYTKNNIRIISTYGTGPYYIFSTKPIKSFEDLKGKKIISTGPMAELLKAMGASPIGIVITESYEALQRGTADGAVYGPSAGGTYHLEEVCKYLLKLPLGGVCGPEGMNLDVWKKLPPDLQKMIDNLPPEHAEACQRIYQIAGDGKYMAKFKTAGLQVSEPSAELMAMTKRIAKEKVWSRWAEKQEKRGVPGNKILDRYIELVEKNAARDPFK